MRMPFGFLGLPSLHSIIEAVANGFFGALASALVPGFLKHGTVATIQHLVALPDPSTWGHVAQLQGEMTYLAAMLMPVTLAAGTLRYWLLGFTGQAHPATALARCTWVTGALVAYGWIVQQTVAATNTLTHAILGFPTVANGLQRIIGVLFGGALLAGAGGVFGAFLVIIGVLFAAGLFAAQVLLTVALALLIVAGPPLIALSAIPELSHLARAWAHALLATMLVPLGWTVLFATAGALCLDATSFTGGAAGLPGHIAAAFAGLITFVLAVKLPWMLFGELRRLLTAGSLTGHGARPSAPPHASGVERVTAAHARLRSAAFDGVPSLGRSVGRAAGAIGAPRGGPLGAARRGFAGAAVRAGVLPATAAAHMTLAGAAARRGSTATGKPTGMPGRLARAGGILRDAPRDAKSAMAARAHNATRASMPPAGIAGFPSRAAGRAATPPERPRSADRPPLPATGAATRRPSSQTSGSRQPAGQPSSPQPQARTRPRQPRDGSDSTTTRPAPRQPPQATAGHRARTPSPAVQTDTPSNPARKITAAAARAAAQPAPEAAKPIQARPVSGATPKEPQPPQPADSRSSATRKPRPRREP
jgi:hypothetical protein